MKKIFFAIFTLAAFLQSCDKHESLGDNYNLDNSLAPYVTLSSTATKTVKQGASTTVTFQLRTALEQKVTVTYNVTGAVNLMNQTVVIDREKTSGVATINIPANTIVAPATTATATVTLVKAVKEDGTQMTIGSKNNPETQKVTLNITL